MASKVDRHYPLHQIVLFEYVDT